MPRSASTDLYDRIAAQAVIPVFSDTDLEVNKRVLEACARAGAELFEFTNRVPRAARLFAELAMFAEKEFPDVILGAGTVRREDAAKEFIHAGAKFIVGPNFHTGIAMYCAGKIPYSPGCATSTELETAQEHLGENAILKVFPGSTLGPGFVRSVLATNRSLRLMITGGVKPDEKNLGEWFSAGAIAVGIGSELINPEHIAAQTWGKLSTEIGAVLLRASEIKHKKK